MEYCCYCFLFPRIQAGSGIRSQSRRYILFLPSENGVFSLLVRATATNFPISRDSSGLFLNLDPPITYFLLFILVGLSTLRIQGPLIVMSWITFRPPKAATFKDPIHTSSKCSCCSSCAPLPYSSNSPDGILSSLRSHPIARCKSKTRCRFPSPDDRESTGKCYPHHP